MDKEHQAIERLKLASEMSLRYYGKPLIVTTSGGKDSSVCVQLAINAGIPFEVMHNHTTADAPETVYFVRDEFKRLDGLGINCILNKPVYKGRRTSMWNLIPQKLMPPTRVARYCCEVLKEHGGEGRMITTGVRWEESVARKNKRGVFEKTHRDPQKRIILSNDNEPERRLFENCSLKAKRVCNPIIDWTEDDVWDYIADQHIPCNPLYCEFARVGCIGCPMAGTHRREREFLHWPKYKQMYILAFEHMLSERQRRGKMLGAWRMGTTATDVFNWWLEYDVLPGQVDLFEGTDAEKMEE